MTTVSLEFTFELDPASSLAEVQERAGRVMDLMLAAEDRTPGLTDSSTGSSGHRLSVSATFDGETSALAALRLRDIVVDAVHHPSLWGLGGVMTHPAYRDLDSEVSA
jgi:hypothetical protein